MNETNTTQVSGQCLCGAVAYTARAWPMVHVCHCGMCRRWSGGPAMALRAESVAFTTGEEQLSGYDSSDWARHVFCKTCGSNLFYQLRESGDYALWVGALTDAAELHLHGEIFIDDKPNFYAFLGEHERVTGAEFIKRVTG